MQYHAVMRLSKAETRAKFVIITFGIKEETEIIITLQLSKKTEKTIY